MKARLAAGDVLIGPVINILHPTLVEVCCAAGADFLFLDFEHGLRGYSDMANALVAAELHDVPALIRLGERSANLVERMLDGGAAGFLFPHVSSAQEAAELVSWCRYKPLGNRGSGFARASLRTQETEYARRQQASHDVVCIMVIESPEGRANLEAILGVDGVTGVAIGPGDLSMELGASDWSDPRVTSILDEMTVTVKRHREKALLRLALTADEAHAHTRSGANIILLNHDVRIIGEAYKKLFGTFKIAP
jgi:2-keto-3-deoxy-L-rhamnonate aldolase RhmA